MSFTSKARRLWCFAEHNRETFSVIIDTNRSVAALRKLVQQYGFRNASPARLTLWKPKAASGTQLCDTIKEDMDISDVAIKLKPVKTVSKYFKTPAGTPAQNDDHIDLIVRIVQFSEASGHSEDESVYNYVIPRGADHDERLAEDNDSASEVEMTPSPPETKPPPREPQPKRPLTLFEQFFDVSVLKENEALPALIARCLFEFVFTGKPKLVPEDKAHKLVESGFGRFTSAFTDEPLVAVIDEPIALLAAAQSLHPPNRSMQHILLTNLPSLKPGPSTLAFERFGAYLLGMAFQSPATPSSVFTYMGRNTSSRTAARLVAIHKNKHAFQCHPVDFSKPNYNLGHSTSNEQQTLAWLRDPKGAVFCFPTKTVGPDLIFALQCSDGALLRVLVQFRCTSNRTRGFFDDDHSNPTDPRHFAFDLTMSPRLWDALYKLGSPSDKSGDEGLLQVLVLYPVEPTIKMVEKVRKSKDAPKLPDAIIGLSTLALMQQEPLDIAQALFSVISRKVEESYP